MQGEEDALLSGLVSGKIHIHFPGSMGPANLGAFLMRQASRSSDKIVW